MAFRYAILLICSLFLINCFDTEKSIGWLEDLDNTCPTEPCWLPRHAMKTEYSGQEAYYFSFEPPLCNIAYTRVILNASGDTLKTYAPNQVDLFTDEVRRGTIIHTCAL